jgi:GR25 family glycosyltransferase involved in LPS biosynthesis
MSQGFLRLAIVVSCLVTLLTLWDGLRVVSYGHLTDEHQDAAGVDSNADLYVDSNNNNDDYDDGDDNFDDLISSRPTILSNQQKNPLFFEQNSKSNSNSNSKPSSSSSSSSSFVLRTHQNAATMKNYSSFLLPPIYWINLDSSVDRQEAMQTMLDELLSKSTTTTTNTTTIIKRISASNVVTTKDLWDRSELKFHPSVQLEGQDGKLQHLKHARRVYEYPEAACLLSHLQAILAAYQDGNDLVLILEDDAVISTTFVHEWKTYLQQAPSDWKILQFATNNKNVVKQGANPAFVDKFVTWQPYHWSTRAYFLNRDGMERILNKTYSTTTITTNDDDDDDDDDESTPRDVWTYSDQPIVVADEVLYYLAGDGYTSMGLWIDSANFGSTIQSNNAHMNLSAVLGERAKGENNNKNKNSRRSSNNSRAATDVTTTSTSTQRSMKSSSLLLLMTLRIRTLTELWTEVGWIRQDNAAVCPFHTTCHWEIQAVLTNHSLVESFHAAIQDFPTTIHFQVRVEPGAFNKFAYLRNNYNKGNHNHTVVDRMKEYDRVVFKDNDQRLVGFPWQTFWSQTGDSIMSGPLRQSVDEALLYQHSLPKRQYFQFHAAHAWTEDWHTQWSANYFAQLKAMEVPILEMYFVLMDGRFAHWFFDLILIPDFLNQTSAWGPDLLWCSAAKDWANSSSTVAAAAATKDSGTNRLPSPRSCQLIPVTSTHEDTRQISKNATGGAHSIAGIAMVQRFKESNPLFELWMRPATNWTKMIGEKQLYQIEKYCRQLLELENKTNGDNGVGDGDEDGGEADGDDDDDENNDHDEDDGSSFDLERCADKMYHLEHDSAALSVVQEAGTHNNNRGRSRNRIPRSRARDWSKGPREKKPVPLGRALLLLCYVLGMSTYFAHFMFHGDPAPPPSRHTRRQAGGGRPPARTILSTTPASIISNRISRRK